VEAPRLGGLAEEVGRLVALLARLLVKVVEDVDEFGEPLAIGELCGTVRESGAEHHGTIDRGRVGHVVAGESGDLVGHHREQAFADIGVDRVRGDLRAAVLVVVEPRAGLLPQLFGFDLLDEQWAGSVRLAEHLVHIFEDVVPHVDTDLVRELERAHREPHVELRRGVDRLDRRVAGLDDPRGLVHQGDEDAVDDEPRAVLPDADRSFSHRLRKPLDQFEGVFGGVFPGDDLDQVHPHRRVEKVHAAEALGPVSDLGEFSDREAGGVGDEDGLLGRVLDDFVVHVLLIAIFSGTTSTTTSASASESSRSTKASHAVERGVCLIFANPVFLGELAERPLDLVVATLYELLFDVPQRHVVAGERAATSAMPWPMFPAPRTVTRWTSSSCIPKGRNRHG